MLRTLFPPTTTPQTHLQTLLHTQNWPAAQTLLLSKPSSARLPHPPPPHSSSSAHRRHRGGGISSPPTLLSIAVRGGAPLDTIRALVEADVEQLVGGVWDGRRGTVVHEAVVGGAGVGVVEYFVGVVIRWERERVWLARGELKPVCVEFGGRKGGRLCGDGDGGSGDGGGDCVGVAIVNPPSSESKQDSTPLHPSTQSPTYPLHTQSTLFNTTDESGRTILHCTILRIISKIITRSRSIPNEHDEMRVLRTILHAFPPAVGKPDRDGRTPLDLVLTAAEPSESSFRRRRRRGGGGGGGVDNKRGPDFDDMEIEMRIVRLVRMLLGVYPLGVVACSGGVGVGRARVTERSLAAMELLLEMDHGGTDVRGVRGGGGGRGGEESSRVMARRRMVRDTVEGTIAHNSLSRALLYGRHFTTVQLLLDANRLAESSWHTGHLRDWNYDTTHNHTTTTPPPPTADNESCTTIISHDHEIPLHIGITMRASDETLSLLLEHSPRSAIIVDRCGLTPICWTWIRFVIDRPHVDDGDGGGDGGGGVRISQRRIVPEGFAHAHQVITEIVMRANMRVGGRANMRGGGNRSRSPLLAVPNAQASAVSDASVHNNGNATVSDTAVRRDVWYRIEPDLITLWKTLEILLPRAAVAARERLVRKDIYARRWKTTSSTTTTTTNTNSNTNNTSSSSSSSSLLHAAAFLDVPRAILSLALHRSPQTNPVRSKDQHGNLPLHYAASRLGYTRLHIPIGPTGIDGGEPISEPSPVFDVLPFYPQAARVADGDGRLPLHLAIELEKRGGGGGVVLDGRRKRSGGDRGGGGGASLMQRRGEVGIKSSPVWFLFESYPEALERRDGVSKLYPFMQAAVGGEGGGGGGATLDMVFLLLRENPAIIRHY